MEFDRKHYKKEFRSETADKIRKRLVDYEKELFLFLDHDNIP